MREYELNIIVQPEISEEGSVAILGRLDAALESSSIRLCCDDLGKRKLAYEINDGLTLAVNVSYDEAFETRVSGNIEYRFGSGNATQLEKKTWQTPVIQALTESVKHRDVRVHDGWDKEGHSCNKSQLGDKDEHNGAFYKCVHTSASAYAWTNPNR